MKTRSQIRKRTEEEAEAKKDNRKRFNTLKRRIRSKKLEKGVLIVTYELELVRGSDANMKSMMETFTLSREEVIAAYEEVINE